MKAMLGRPHRHILSSPTPRPLLTCLERLASTQISMAHCLTEGFLTERLYEGFRRNDDPRGAAPGPTLQILGIAGSEDGRYRLQLSDGARSVHAMLSLSQLAGRPPLRPYCVALIRGFESGTEYEKW